ncbi:MAG: hypothetical protein NC819_03900 [Candidatus Omnitrophica bacterium]|nr:hypothetical protein [Candidatus Omnitrophota bacterium]
MAAPVKLFTAVLFAGLWFLYVSAETGVARPGKEAVFEDPAMEEAFEKAHGVMRDQKNQMARIADGFFEGDAGAIRRGAGRLGQDMAEIRGLMPANADPDAFAWRAVSEITQQSQLLERNAVEGNYTEAFDNFTAIMRQCIECHQAHRYYGTFPDPAEEIQKKKRSE